VKLAVNDPFQIKGLGQMVEGSRLNVHHVITMSHFCQDDPLFDSMRSEPRFKALLKKMNLE
jgi:hypothetical protein